MKLSSPRHWPPLLVTALVSALVLTGLWLLSPSRSDRVTPAGVVEITYMGPNGPIAGALDDAVRAFEEESRRAHAADPSKPVYRVISGQNASRGMTGDPTRFLLSVAGGMPPDVIYFDRFAVAEWSTRDAFLDLNPLVEHDLAVGHPDAVRGEDYYAPTWNEVVFTNPITGHTGLYGIPDAFESRALIYNKDWLRRAGYVDENGEAKPPRTWEELVEMAVALTEHDESGRIRRLGFAPLTGAGIPYQFGWQNGGEIISADGQRVTLNDPRFVAAFEWMVDFYRRLGGIKEVRAFDTLAQAGDLDPFITGRIAMKLDGYWMTQYGFSQYGDRVNYGVAPPPMPARELAAGRRPESWIGGWCYAIPSGARHPEAAWELVRFLASPRARRIMAESQRLTAQSQGRPYVPSQSAHRLINEENLVRYVDNDPTLPANLKAAVHAFSDIVADSRFRPASPVGQMMFNEAANAADAALYGTATPQEALDRATQTAQRELDRALAPPRGRAVNWSILGWLYAALLIGGGVFIFRWDTSSKMRAKVWRMLTALRLAKSDGWKDDFASINDGSNRHQWLGGLLCASPWLIGFLVFTGGPILFSVLVSFADYDVLSPATWTGLSNYKRMFSGDPLVPVAVVNTLFMMLGIPLGLAVGLGIALLLNVEVRGVALWRTCFYLPSIVPAVASSILWIWIFNPQSGLLNRMLGAFGIHGPNWLQDAGTAKIALILMGLWGAGGGMVIWLAGLKSIPASYYEAARLDGANAWQQFCNITLPLLSPYILFNLIMGVIGTLQLFSQAFIMTQGGPVNSTLFYVYHLFNHAFRYLNMGYASALAWGLVIVVFILTVAQLKLSRRWVHYEGD